MPVYEKLVRDRIPEIIQATGKEFAAERIGGADLRAALQQKLLEEAQEFVDSDGDVGELADVLEVVEALAAHLGVSMDDVFQIKTEKRQARGGFEHGIWLEWVED